MYPVLRRGFLEVGSQKGVSDYKKGELVPAGNDGSPVGSSFLPEIVPADLRRTTICLTPFAFDIILRSAPTPDFRQLREEHRQEIQRAVDRLQRLSSLAC